MRHAQKMPSAGQGEAPRFAKQSVTPLFLFKEQMTTNFNSFHLRKKGGAETQGVFASGARDYKKCDVETEAVGAETQWVFASIAIDYNK